MDRINNLDLNLLKSLKVLLSEKHVSQAADRLNVAQSTMSHSLRKLRDFFADPLLVRVGKRMELTERAQQLSRSLEIIFEELSVADRGCQFVPENIDVLFRIVTSQFCLSQGIAKAIQRMQVIAPKMAFNITNFSPKTGADLIEGKTDLLVGFEDLKHPTFRRRQLAELPVYCLLAQDHPALNNWCAEEIFNYPHMRVVYPDYVKGTIVDLFAEQNGYVRDIKLSTNDAQMQLPLLTNSEIITFFPKPVAEDLARTWSLAAVPCPMEFPHGKISMMWTEINQSNPINKWVRQMILDELSFET